MTHQILLTLKIDQLESRAHNHVWLGINLYKRILPLKLVFMIFQSDSSIRLVNYHFERHDLNIFISRNAIGNQIIKILVLPL